jgi:ankyrin repeat/IBR domain-containing protein 1
VEVTAKDIRGNTALHYAAANGLRRCVEYLVAHGAEVFLDNYDGLTVSFFVQKDKAFF